MVDFDIGLKMVFDQTLRVTIEFIKPWVGSGI